MSAIRKSKHAALVQRHLRIMADFLGQGSYKERKQT